MGANETVYILGVGAIGFPLAAFLAEAGRPVVAVRTSRRDVPRQAVTVTVRNGGGQLSEDVEMVSLSNLSRLEGTVVVTAKSYANGAIARALREKAADGPIVVMQNGVGVEKLFLDAGFSSIYRCVLYITSQATGRYEFMTRPVTPSPIGVVRGDGAGLEEIVALLSTERFRFRKEGNIQREIWKKAIINAAFNSICPLLEVDNGIFVRDEAAEGLARALVQECVALTERLELGLGEEELMAQLLRISRGSEGQLISTLQDLRAGRRTEIEYLNLEIARVAASLEPPVAVPRTALLGEMVLVKSSHSRP